MTTAKTYQKTSYQVLCGNYCGMYASVVSYCPADRLRENKAVIAEHAPACPVCNKCKPVVVVEMPVKTMEKS